MKIAERMNMENYKTIHGVINKETFDNFVESFYKISDLKDVVQLLRNPKLPVELIHNLINKIIEYSDFEGFKILSVDNVLWNIICAQLKNEERNYHFFKHFSYMYFLNHSQSSMKSIEWKVFTLNALYNIYYDSSVLNVKVDHQNIGQHVIDDLQVAIPIWTASAEAIDALLYQNFDFLETSSIALADNCSHEIMELLSHNDSPMVRSSLASRRKVSSVILERLSHDHHPIVRFMVASNTSTPSDILVDLLKDDNYDVSREVLFNSSFPYELLLKILENGTDTQKTMAIKNPQLTFEVLDIFAEDSNSLVRFNAIHHPNYPQAMRFLRVA